MFTAPYTYHLPEDRIAHAAAEPRDSAKLLHRAPGGTLTDRIFRDLPSLLKPNDLLILNTSKVIPARLYLERKKREGDGAIPIELLLHRSLTPNLSRWSAFAKPARRLKQGDILTLPESPEAVLEVTGKREDGTVEVTFLIPSHNVSGFLETHGHTPLPPYIHADDTAATRARYQTVYANQQQPGSVAAPTAGLHFTPDILAKINTAPVTLHVGAGTFLNPTEEQIKTKTLHAEYIELSPDTAQKILATKRAGGRIIPVGTTALRSLESWARLGNMSEQGYAGETTLFLQPGDDFKVADALMTNFHLPDSSLLMLVAAFIGLDEMHRLYAHALQNSYRFYSFGDTSLLERRA